MMKRVKDTIIITIGMILFLFVIGRVEWHEDYDTRDATVTRIEGNTISVVDSVGYYWEFYGEGYNVGDEVRLLMCLNHTAAISDDVVESVEYR